MAKYYNPVDHLRRVVLLCLVKLFSGHFYRFFGKSHMWSSGFSVEAGNRRIPPPVKTKVAGCSGYEICLCAPFFLKIKYEWAFKKYSRIFRLFGGTH